jgi:uncharacterized protein DUF2071
MRFPKHPFPVRTVFRRCLLVNFAVEPSLLAGALPPSIEPDVHKGRAFLSVVVGQMERMRPAGVPRALGITYNQIVYRAVVRCSGERGVHFLRSDADSRMMSAFGNLMSFFRFHRSLIAFRSHDGVLDLDVTTSSRIPGDIHATFTVGAPSSTLPGTSAFSTVEEAKHWLVELFVAFDRTPGSANIDLVRIRRGEWDVRVVEDLRGDYGFMTAGAPFTPETARLDSIFLVGDVPYYWHRLEKTPARA